MHWSCFGIAVLALLGSSCDDPFIDPFVEGKHFTLYGYLYQFDIDHYVRVVPVRRSPEDISAPNVPHAEIDALVTSKNLTTGEEHRWVQTLRELDDGTYGHVFQSAFIVRKGHTYEITVTRSDGARSVATTRVPNPRDVRDEPAIVVGDSIVQTLVWPDIATPESILVTYCAKPVGGFQCGPLAFDYGRQGRRTDEGWEIDIDLGRDLDAVRAQLGLDDGIVLELSSLDILFTALDDQWLLPEEPIEIHQFAQPNALTNVENGFGFWGSIARSGVSWMPDSSVLALKGFVPPA